MPASDQLPPGVRRESRVAFGQGQRAGAVAVHRGGAPPILGHIHSTLRMGHSATDSVLDASGEARWVRRLFVADNSALANALGGPNPTLTTQALATRAAERVFLKYFAGTPWVAKETPTASTDDRVTQAVRERHL
jgi:choline dehydrogenase-like flavoprotein